MRAVECPAPSCGHIHAPSDETLVRLLLQHSHQAHPGMRLAEQAAEEYVDESGYSDKKHAKQSFGDFLTDSASKAY